MVAYVLLLGLLTICLNTSAGFSQDTLGPFHEADYAEIISWEPDDLVEDTVGAKKQPALFSPFAIVSLSLIRIYKKRISVNSTLHRCPFRTSCSSYAFRSITEHGFWMGLVIFIDRYYYRENPGTPYLYPLTETHNGLLKLNDNFFLDSKPY